MRCAGCRGKIPKEQQKIAKRFGAKRIFCRKCTRERKYLLK